MIAEARTSVRVILYEGAGSKPLATGRRFELMQRLLESGYAVSSVRAGGQLPQLGHRLLVVLGCFDGATPPAAESAEDDAEVRFLEIGDQDVDAVVTQLGEQVEELGEAKPGGWKPWFPVIDFKRCTNCMQCLSFCLFDVYGVTADAKITVQNETNCKTDCPACSRVCPEVAILFPKYKAGPINGDEISDDDLRREAMKVDISSLLGGDIYSMLRDRSEKAKSRFSKERDDDRALKERQRCMKALQKQMGDLDIPADVMSSLPSLNEIQAKAETAKQKAQSALDQQAGG
jgi:Pyruvate/2-oxoacid:ferredoxin oxidoreductase delta subunit